MRTVRDFIIKHEFWFSALIVLGLYVGEYRIGEMWMGNLAFLLFLIAGTRLALHPMTWRKDED